MRAVQHEESYPHIACVVDLSAAAPVAEVDKARHSTDSRFAIQRIGADETLSRDLGKYSIMIQYYDETVADQRLAESVNVTDLLAPPPTFLTLVHDSP